MNTFFHITSEDPERKCHLIKPFTSSKLNAEILSNGKVRTENAILNLKKKIIAITNAKEGQIGLCCKNPIGQDYNKELLASFRELFPSVREIKEGGKIKYLEVSTEPVLEQYKGWQQLTPYHVCKLTTANLEPITGRYNHYRVENLTNDCYTSNCDNQLTLSLEQLMGEETNPIEYSYYDDLKLVQSIEDGNLEYIKSYLFKYNAINNVLTHDDFGNYIIHIATRYYNKKVFDLIVAMRPNVNVENTDGDTPLHIACLYGKVDAINELYKLGAEVNAKNKKGFTPLMMVVQYKDNNKKEQKNKSNPFDDFRLTPVAIMIKSLITKGANINATNNKGETVLHIIVKEGQTSTHLSMIVRMLMENGVDVEIKDKEGKTALAVTGELIGDYDNLNEVKEPFQVKSVGSGDLMDREVELREIQTMLFNQTVRNNADKYSTYVNVSEIPEGAPIEVLNYMCSGSNPEIQGIEDKEKCERLGGAFTKVKNPTTKVKVELIQESDRMILAEQEEDLYLDKYPESLPLKELPEEIKQINQKPRFSNNVSNNMNSNNTKTIKNDTYVDRDSMINIPMKNGKLVTNDNKKQNSFTNILGDTNDDNKNDNNDNNDDNDNNMLLNKTEDTHPIMISSVDLTNSINDAMNNSNSLMLGSKSNISKVGFMENNKKFLKDNAIGIVLILILLIALIKLFLM
jgi:hypothetical protein